MKIKVKSIPAKTLPMPASDPRSNAFAAPTARISNAPAHSQRFVAGGFAV